METSVFFKAKLGHTVSNGPCTVRFIRDILEISDPQELAMLRSCESVTEITEAEAVEAYPEAFQVKAKQLEPTKKELVEIAEKAGFTKDEIKAAKTNDDLKALIATKQDLA